MQMKSSNLRRKKLERSSPAPSTNQDAVERAKELQKAIFGSCKIADESAELICQAREERLNQL